MKGNKEKILISIIIGIICVIFVFVMTVQMRTVKETDITSIEKMREEELKEQIEIWKTKYEETQSKIEDDNNKIKEYKDKEENNQEASELLKTELSQMKTVLGKTDVEGEGVIINLSDGNGQINSEDLIKLVNELKLAGAEAISINDERIINLTDIVDVNSYVIINGKRTESPFKIKAIGDQQYLNSGLMAKGGFADTEKNEEKNITITLEKNVVINKYDKDLSIKYIKE